VNPTQSLRCLEVLAGKLPTGEHLGIGQRCREVGRVVNRRDVDPRKTALEAYVIVFG
jgi:hypothetical protein